MQLDNFWQSKRGDHYVNIFLISVLHRLNQTRIAGCITNMQRNKYICVVYVTQNLIALINHSNNGLLNTRQYLLWTAWQGGSLHTYSVRLRVCHLSQVQSVHQEEIWRLGIHSSIHRFVLSQIHQRQGYQYLSPHPNPNLGCSTLLKIKRTSNTCIFFSWVQSWFGFFFIQ